MTLNKYAVYLGLSAVVCCSPLRAVTLEWTRQLGSASDDYGRSVSIDGLGNVYIAGETEGALNGANAGSSDAFLSNYDNEGNRIWTQQLGASDYDVSYGVSADGLGAVFITGWTASDLGGANAGDYDAFLSKYDATGGLSWTRQIGSVMDDQSRGVSADGLGNVYITGRTFGDLEGVNQGADDIFVSKFDSAGNLLWTEQVGTNSNDLSYAVSADHLGDVYIAGMTYGELGGAITGEYDVFVSKYDATGSRQWTRQFGTASDERLYSISADGLGHIYVAGQTEGDLGAPSAGNLDAFVTKLDATGDLLWTRQIGTAGDDHARGVAADGRGNVYLTGYTMGDLEGDNAGSWDAFLVKYADTGDLAWTEQFGSATWDTSSGVSADGRGAVYLSGSTLGALGAPNAGGYDAFIAKFSDPVPEPTGAALLAALAASLLGVRRDRRRVR